MAKIALCQDVMTEFMGLMSISAVLKQEGHTVELFIDDQTSDRRFLAELSDYQPDIGGFSICTPTVPWALRLARWIKQHLGAVTVFGNIHAITNPEIIEESGVDIVCVGEGERPMAELASCVDRDASYDHIESFWLKTPHGIKRNALPKTMLDLDSLPLHDLGLYDKYPFFRRSTILRVLAGRGCPYRCSFCTNPLLLKHFGKKYLRKRTPELVIRELEQRIRERRVHFVHFVDEVLWVKNDWLREFLTLYRDRIRLPFIACYRFGGGITEDDIKLMAEAGARQLSLSCETGDERQRFQVMNKPVRDQQYIEVAGWLRKHKIGFVSGAFFGLPGDTVQDHVNRLDFYRQLKPTYLWTTFFQPYPKLPLTLQPDTQAYLPDGKDFKGTFHHEMYLDLPDRPRLTNLKKVYFLCMLSRTLTPVLVWLTKFRIPIFFDALFLAQHAYYSIKFGHVSARQFFTHVRLFGINPILRKWRLRRESAYQKPTHRPVFHHRQDRARSASF